MTMTFDSVPDGLLFTSFQVVLGIAVTFAGLIELAERRWNWSAFGHPIARSEFTGADERERVLEIVNRISVIGRISLGIPLAVGAGGPVLAWSTVLLLMVALRLRPKHSLLYITICTIVIAAASTQGFFSGDYSSIPSWAPITVTIALFGLYLNGAWWKWNSAQFRSGATLYVILVGHRVGNFLGVRYSRSAPEPVRKWCHRAALAVIVSETALPVLLLIPPIAPLAIGAGTLMHLLFFAVQPSRLLPFQMAALGSYACVEMVR